MALTLILNTALISFDATLTEKHTADAVVTEHPVEQGADIADHVRPKQATLEITGLITDYPVSAAGPTNVPGSAAAQYAQLEQFKDTGTQFAVSTSTKYYPTCVIESLSSSKDKDLDGAIRFTMGVKGVVTVESEQVVLSKTTEPKTKALVDGGKQSTTAATSQQQARSLLASGAKALSTLFQ
jgi:hypothetical protein